jgi:NodT family efflux transporter outer membrane factor (OMF) lipoprotein
MSRWRLRARAAAAAALLGLAGCDLAPPYHRPTAAIPAAYKETGPWAPATPYDQLRRGPWWRMYRDPELDRLEAQLLVANPTLKAAVANFDVARAYAAQVRSALFPSLLLGGTMTGANPPTLRRSMRIPNAHNYFGFNTINGEVDYQADLFDQIRNEVVSGKDLAQVTAAQLANVQLLLETDLASAYLSLRGLDTEARMLADTVAAYTKAYQIVNNRFLGKIASGLDLSRAATQLESAKAAEQDIIAQRALIEHAIASLVGRPASSFAVRPAVVKIAVPRIPTGVPSALLQRRPDIAAAERQVAAANARIGVARAAFYPDVTLGLLGGLQTSGWVWLAGAPFSYFALGPRVIAPIFEGGLLRAQLAGAYADMRQVTEEYRAVVLAAFQQVEDNLSLLNNLARETAAADAAVADATRTLNMAMAMYMNGAVNYLEVAVAQEQLLTEEVAQITLTTRRQIASVGLIRALGGGWSERDLPSGKALFLYATDPPAAVKSR